MLRVSALHTVYWEVCGPRDGIPVVFLHGGPGGGCTARHRQFFDPTRFRVVLFDQRGCGRSTPLGETRENTTPLLVEDIERLRNHLGIERWFVFGGSWGSTLALSYGQAHPSRCLGFVLRGIFLGTGAEIDWFLHGMGRFFPEAEAAFRTFLPEAERADLLAHYGERIDDPDPRVHMPACQAWARYESACASLRPSAPDTARSLHDAFSLGLARMESHFMRHACFLEPEQLMRGMPAIQGIPAHIVQGRYDVICPPARAYALAAHWPAAHLKILPDAGHSAHEPSTEAALVEALAALFTHLKLKPHLSAR
jgi:proline iminopeptidase